MMDGDTLRLSLVFFLFALQHSLTVSEGFKKFMVHLIGEQGFAGAFRLLFTIWNLLLLSLLLFYWRRLPDHPLFVSSAGLTWSLHGIQLLGLWILYRAGKEIDLLHFIGVRQWMDWRRHHTSPEEELITTGIYRQIRHPIYSGSILILSGEVHLLETANGLLLVLLATAYFVIGSMMEERRMIRQFGKEYQDYRKKTGRFLPKFRIVAP